MIVERLSVSSFTSIPLEPRCRYASVKLNEGVMFCVDSSQRFDSSDFFVANGVPQYASSVYGVLVLYCARFSSVNESPIYGVNIGASGVSSRRK